MFHDLIRSRSSFNRDALSVEDWSDTDTREINNQFN